jgi:hypothetical protein
MSRSTYAGMPGDATAGGAIVPGLAPMLDRCLPAGGRGPIDRPEAA